MSPQTNLYNCGLFAIIFLAAKDKKKYQGEDEQIKVLSLFYFLINILISFKEAAGRLADPVQYLQHLNMATDEYEQNIVNDPDQEELELRDPGFESLMHDDLPNLFNEYDL